MAEVTKTRLKKNITMNKSQNDPEKKKKKSQTREYTEAIFVALLAALFIRTFIIQAFRIPTGSMKDTLLVGDFLLVNKFVYGARTPDSIPFTEILLPYLRLPAFKEPETGEIVVFKFPDNLTQDYIKRCIAAPGQMFEIRNGEVFVDNQPEGKKELINKQYDADEGHFIEYYKITRNDGKTYTIRHYSDQNFQARNFPTFRIPQKGDSIELTSETLAFGNPMPGLDKNGNDTYTSLYKKIIEQYEGHSVSQKDDKIYIDGREAVRYTFENDYYFMMGDNRDNSSDGRVWGVLPKENIVGEALIIYWSWDWDWDQPLYELFSHVRWGRIANLIR